MEDKVLINVPLGAEAHRFASEFSVEHTDPDKSKQIYLNTLAVYAVHRYLKWLQIETSLRQSDSWNPALRGRLNVADLVVPAIGKLECRPILPGEDNCLIPQEVLESERIAYLAVLFNEQLDRAQLRGFKRIAWIDREDFPKSIPLQEFVDMECFSQYLERVRRERLIAAVNVALWHKEDIGAFCTKRRMGAAFISGYHREIQVSSQYSTKKNSWNIQKQRRNSCRSIHIKAKCDL